jgi:hypothetical protein
MNGEFYTQSGHRRCRGITAKRKQCARRASKAVCGVNVCKVHHGHCWDRQKSLAYVTIPGIED